MPAVRKDIGEVTIRFAGDSGDGIQLTGMQFTDTSVLAGNDISTLPDFPAEIRAPAGTLPGVSGFQVRFGSGEILTPGDEPNVLVAMNPAALKVNIPDLEKGGIIIANEDAFKEANLKKAGYKANPLEDGTLKQFQIIKLPLSTLTSNALQGAGLTWPQIERCKNFFALGIMYWLYDRPLDYTLKWIEDKFGKVPEIKDANVKALKAGYHYADITEIFTSAYRVHAAPTEPGLYRKISGNEGTTIGLITAAKLAGLKIFYGSYPITPASDILQYMANYKEYGVLTFQAEDEIAAVTSAIGASYGGNLGVTGTSGPGLALKSEGMGLAVMVELPLVIVDVQRAGPSTGMPTKTEQADLLQAYAGRSGESPVVLLAPATPGDCFHMAMEAVRIAVQYMTPVIYLSDAYLASGAEPWKIPDVKTLPRMTVERPQAGQPFFPYQRDSRHLARPWALPGTPGLEHRIGGLEKADVTGNVSYDAENHEKMVRLRAEKIERVADSLPPLSIRGDAEGGELLIVGWGSTYGAITTAVDLLRKEGKSVSSIHLRYLNPLPKDLGPNLKRFKKILVPELNLGQLRMLLRAKFLLDVQGLNKVKGRPFKISEILAKSREMLS